MDESLGTEVNEVYEKLCQVIYELDALCSVDASAYAQEPPSVESVLILGRKIAPTTISPTFVRFNSEVGPLEPMPSRFRVPFPTMEDFKFSVLNFQRPVVETVAPAPIPRKDVNAKKIDDEYADDF